MISMQNVVVSYGSTTVLPEFSLDVKEGEFFTLLGPSGCGKTTALRALAGLTPVTSGKILVGGKDVTRLPSDKRQLGMVFQNYALFPSMSVRDNIGFGLKVAKRPQKEIERAVREAAESVDITEEQLGRGISELSGGQQQRVAIARALVTRPKILLMDEPLSNLDAKLRKRMREQLKLLQREFGVTSIYVTHDQDEALSMSDRIAVLDKGRIAQVGTPEDVYSRSRTEGVCQFIGDVNRLPGEFLKGATTLPRDGARHYVRFEDVAVQARGGETPPGSIVVPGTVAYSGFNGPYRAYMIECAGHKIRASVYGTDRDHEHTGSAVDIVIRPERVMSYTEDGVRC
ncbi:ABC transporter ATP-binding protein [Falsarthrobacter nasiphocae]|uniref:Iron(III) transport system ATP-binding protein n=1 Tax=Falsarthrobacter nasiphocae TaxID=189863 RepID=A0AAE4C509_9MICC|nr:ABC transporter ATP-binding protein [Falsarthrobacter nasiphocae]MDR6891861.1 iron(III) transport system ATP-binding protein [Falsarthrobacter nasiphocae]